MKHVLSALLFFALFQQADGKVDLPNLLANGMVLQQKAEVQLWGRARKKATVAVTTSWNNQTHTTKTDAQGYFLLLVKTPAAGGPYTLHFDDGEKTRLKDILIGEVWLCSGQSNMDMPLKGYRNQPVDGANTMLANAGHHPIRLFRVPRVSSARPLSTTGGRWTNADAENAREFSAVGYQFAQFLQHQLKVPVGIIQSTWGGTNITSWMSAASLRAFPEIEIVPDTASVAKPADASTLFNAMIHPLLPFRIRGVIWYQGEANRRNPATYAQLMQSMVTDWRQRWNSSELPFYYVQIAPWNYTSYSDQVPYLQEAQFKAMSLIPHSGMVVSVDAGSPTTIHPSDKTSISQRLAWWALGHTYGKNGIAYQSPHLVSVKFNDSQAHLTFNHAPNGLYSTMELPAGFELAGDDRVFHPATAAFTQKGITLRSDAVQKPVAARYAFTHWIKGSVYSTDGLPLGPFRTDDWPLPSKPDK